MLRWKISRWCNWHRPGPQRNIFLFSTPRSGSTWLMEMIAKQAGIKVINEPFLLTRFQNTQTPLPSRWDILLPHEGREALLASYLQQLINNRLGIGSPRPGTKLYRWKTNRILFKILRCKDLMNWCEQHFNAQILYLVRHPVATAVSRTRFSRLPLFLSNEFFCQRYLTKEQHHYALHLLESGSELEQKVLDWSLQNLPPLRYQDRSHWTCITYEELVAQPHQTLAQLGKALQLPHIEKLYQGIDTPSGSSRHCDPATQSYLEQTQSSENRSPLLSKWRTKVSATEEQQAFEILQRFGLDLYAYGQDMPTKKL